MFERLKSTPLVGCVALILLTVALLLLFSALGSRGAPSFF
jgi:hypothetical protein